jgi:hypothetical protein
MRDSVLLPGMALPRLSAPPPEPHRDKVVQNMRETYDMRIIAWDGVWQNGRRPQFLTRHAGVQLGRDA